MAVGQASYKFLFSISTSCSATITLPQGIKFSSPHYICIHCHANVFYTVRRVKPLHIFFEFPTQKYQKFAFFKKFFIIWMTTQVKKIPLSRLIFLLLEIKTRLISFYLPIPGTLKCQYLVCTRRALEMSVCKG